MFMLDSLQNSTERLTTGGGSSQNFHESKILVLKVTFTILSLKKIAFLFERLTTGGGISGIN